MHEKIGQVGAQDSDGTAPGNQVVIIILLESCISIYAFQVGYEIIANQSSEKVEDYFRLDQETGEIFLQVGLKGPYD